MKRTMKMFKIVSLLLILTLGFASSAMAKQNLTGHININSATTAQIMLLPRVGEAKANAIREYVKNNKISQLEDLLQIKGIGEKTITKWKDYIKFDGDTTLKELDS